MRHSPKYHGAYKSIQITIKYFQSIVNLKLKLWGYNVKNVGFHLSDTKKALLPVASWGKRM